MRLSTVQFAALGLISFWIYPALRLGHALGTHFAMRWMELEARGELRASDPRLAALRATGFAARRAAPWSAAALFAASGVLAGASLYKGALVIALAAAAAFYAGAFLLVFWTLNTLRRHEMLELLVRERGAGALLERTEPGDDLARRWEWQSNHVIAFLVLAAPLLASPLFARPAVSLPLLMLFHAWGSVLLAGLYNDHLAEEKRHELTAPLAEHASPAARGDERPRRARVAIMLTDMQDYSKSMGVDESGAYARLVEHNRIMRAAIAAHRGREIKTIGDAFLVIFRSARNAVECALAAQRAFAEHNAGRNDEERIHVRIGIHWGEVMLTGTDIFGDDVNVAARIEPLAAPGGVCVSEPVLRIARRAMRPERLVAEPLEGATLKNIAAPPKLYRLRPQS